jgi:hypothetical protein
MSGREDNHAHTPPVVNPFVGSGGPSITKIEPHGDLGQLGIGREPLPSTREDEPERTNSHDSYNRRAAAFVSVP